LLEEGELPPPPLQAARNKARLKVQLCSAARNPDVNISSPRVIVA
jgi:hypothetical protein